MLCFTKHYNIEPKTSNLFFKKVILLLLIFAIFIASIFYLYLIWRGIQADFDQKYLEKEIQNTYASYQKLEAAYFDQVAGLNKNILSDFGLEEAKNAEFVKAQTFVAEVFPAR